MLAQSFAGAKLLLSDYVESEAWGYNSSHKFLNRGVLVLSYEQLEAVEVLRRAQTVEKAICAAPHRRSDGSYADRAIDIDVIDVDGLVVDTPELTLPHPRAALRAFVMGPMRELEERYSSMVGRSEGSSE